MATICETQKDLPTFIRDNFKFRIHRTWTTGELWWACCKATRKFGCKARIKTTSDHQFINQSGDHNHDSDVRDVEKNVLTTGVKRKYDEGLIVKPSKIIRLQLRKMNETSIKPADLDNCIRCLYY